MSWWKQRWTAAAIELRKLGVEQVDIDKAAISLGRDEPAIAPAGEGRDESISGFQRAIGGNRAAASNWVAWAERKHLLVRGASVQCPECRAQSWLPMTSLPPPVGCSGCGREIMQPYGPDGLSFRYRIGEPLRRVLETDSLGHVLVLHWLTKLFGERGSLVGAHPGVTFTDPKAGKDVGEADVVLLFASGDIVPLEVKRRHGGVDQRTIGLMDDLARALASPWDGLAVTQAARDCPDVASFRQDLPTRPRFILTYVQLLDPMPIWTLGSDPFAWLLLSPQQDEGRRASFVQGLTQGDLDYPTDYVSDSLLDENLD
jgi:hypothetical protein